MADWLATGKMWSDIFVLGAPLIEKILRPVAVYFFLVIALRVFGKRELAQLNLNYLVVRFLFRHRRLDQIFEGKPSTLIEHGKILKRELSKELMTRAELMTVLHRQGFDALSDVERCVLEPGGTFYIQRKLPPTQELEHQEVMRTLRELTHKLDRLLEARGEA